MVLVGYIEADQLKDILMIQALPLRLVGSTKD